MSDLRRNALALGADYGLFQVGLSFAGQVTILPAFAAWLGAPNVVIGAIPAVMTLGWFLPSLFAAGHTEALARKMPFILRWTIWERVPYAVLALLAFFVAGPAPGLTLALLLVLLLVSTGVGGLLMPAWMDVIGRAIPTAMRGRFFALSSLAGGVLGFGVSFVVAAVLAHVPAPASYGLCFVGASAALALSYAAMRFVREPASGAVAARVDLRTYLARVPALLRRDRNLLWFLAARAFAMGGFMASAFFTVYALRAWDAPASQAGIFSALMVAGHALGTLTLGWVADHAGHRLVLLFGMASAIAANVVALLAPSLAVFGVVFVLTGLRLASVNVSNLTVLLEFAPTPEEQPTYIGLGSTLMAPVACATPLLAGLLADALGFRAVFVVALLTGAVGFLMLAMVVRDPRGLGTRAVEEATA